MRDNRREPTYGDYNRHYNQGDENWQHSGHYQGQRHADLGDTRREQGQYYRMQQSETYGRRGGKQGTQEDHYMEMYDTSNYDGNPRNIDYGLPYGAENDLDDLRRYPLSEGPYAQREHYRYSQGSNPNYDNPEEGDRYRDFDSRGNHGYRHDAGYGATDDFREFGDDRYGRANQTGNMHYGHFGGYNR